MKPRYKSLTPKARDRRARRWIEKLYAVHATPFRRLPMNRPWKVHHAGRLR